MLKNNPKGCTIFPSRTPLQITDYLPATQALMDLQRMKTALFGLRFEILAFLLTAIIFGGGIAPETLFEDVIVPVINFLITVLAVLMVRNGKLPIRMIFYGFAFLAFLLMFSRVFAGLYLQVRITSLLLYILFFAALSYEVFRQMLGERNMTRSIIFAAFDCYLLLGVLGAMLFTLLFVLDPQAFANVSQDAMLFNKMSYFSFITLTSIGYGDITPASDLAQRFTAFYGLIGHFYSVVIVGIIVGKYVAVRSEERP